MAIAGKYGSWIVDTDEERDSLIELANGGDTCHVNTLPTKQYVFSNGGWVQVGGTPNVIVSETEPVEKYDGLIWIDKSI